MPTGTSQPDSKSRQSSGGRSFFGRRLHKEKSNGYDDGNLVPETPSTVSSAMNSFSSRHSTRDSVASIDTGHGVDYSGFAVTTGPVASVPYDSVASNGRIPIPVDYLPRDEHNVRKGEPLPHHVNTNGADFHQYPTWEGVPSPGLGSSHSNGPTGPRPPPHVQQSLVSREKSGASLQPGRPTTSTSFANGSHGFSNSYPTVDTSNSRNSFDHASIMSTASSATRGSFFTSDNGSRTAIPSYNPEPVSRSTASSRHSHLHNAGWHPQLPSGSHSTVSFNSEGFYLPRPTDEKVIEEQFVALMRRRGWQNLPDQAKRQMLAYPSAKKWTLVHQDQLADWQNEQKRRQNARQTVIGSDGTHNVLARADEEGSPEWYVKRVMNDLITAKELGSLSVSLRTQPISWVKSFVEAQGQVALTNVLAKINRRQAQGPAPAAGTTSDKDLDREYDIVKCLKALMNNKYGADDALNHQQVIVSLVTSLISPRLTTRKLVSEVLTFLCHWAEGEGHLKVLQALDHVKNQQCENGRFDAWMRIVEVTIDGRGKMGSLVGASEEVRSGGIGMENLLMEYAVASLFLLNMIIDAPEHDLQLRCHIRAQFTSCGIKRILTKMEGFQYEIIDKQIDRYRENEAIDYEDLLQRENSSMKDSIEGEVKDMQDPAQIVDAIMTKVQGSRAQDYFLSALQHMLLIRDNEGEDRLRMFQLVDAMLSYVAMDRRLPDMDLKQSLNFSVQSLLDRLHTDSEARQAIDETVESRQIAEAALAERDEMRDKIELGANGLVAKLQQQLEEQAAIIELQGRKADAMQAELADLQRIRAQELERNELETRELYLMLRDAQEVAASAAKNGGKEGLTTSDPKHTQGILDRERLMDRLEMQLERAKTQYKLEGKVWQQAGPSDRLRELREQMDGNASKEELQIRMARNFSPLNLSYAARSQMLRGPRRAAADALAESELQGLKVEGDGDEAVVFEKPRIIEMKRPQMNAKQATGILGEIASRVRRYDASEDEDTEGDGVTTGPSHPSLESDTPKTPLDENILQAEHKISGPAPPSLPPLQTSVSMPGFEAGPSPPPPPPPPPQMLQSSANIPGFDSGPLPPPAPPPPMSSSLSTPATPSMPGFSSSAPPPPPPPPMLGAPRTPISAVNGSMAPPPPPMPGASPVSGARHGGYLPQAQTQYSQTQNFGMPFIRSKKKLKALHWEKVDTPQVTVWAAHTPTHESKEEKYIELSRRGVLDEVEKLFLAKEIKKIGTAGGRKSDKKQIISSDLMRNFHISLAKFSQIPVEEVVRMIIHCDKEVLDNDVVMNFLQKDDMCIIPDNTAKLMAPYSKDWNGPDALITPREQDPVELTREDQIYLQTVFELRHYWKSRMRALAMTRSYETEYDEVANHLKEVIRVSESLRDSLSLMNVLGLILDIGNYMNDSNKQAAGFKLSSLGRLGMIKDDKNESTFADLVERIVRTQYPDWQGFVDEIGGVVTAQKLNVEQLQLDAKRYIDNIKNVQSSLDSGNLSDSKKFHPQDRVSQVVQRSMKEARRKAEQMQLYLDEMKRTYDDIMTFYGEDSSDDNARREFFSKLAIFVTEWKRSKEKNIAMEDTRRRNEASMARKRANLPNGSNSTIANSGVSSPDGAMSPSGTGAMDSLLEKLRAAAPQARDTRDRRRRARLKDRHQVRVASGQKIPDMAELTKGGSEDEDGDKHLLSPDGANGEKTLSRVDEHAPLSEAEDVAERAASMLQGLRGDGDADGEGTGRESSLRIRRRRESVDDDRRSRRRRRGQGSNSSAGSERDSTVFSQEQPAILEETPEYGESDNREDGNVRNVLATPRTLVSPPSPDGTKSKPLEIE